MLRVCQKDGGSMGPPEPPWICPCICYIITAIFSGIREGKNHELQFEGSQNSVDQLLEKICSAPVGSQPRHRLPVTQNGKLYNKEQFCKLRLPQVEL